MAQRMTVRGRIRSWNDEDANVAVRKHRMLSRRKNTQACALARTSLTRLPSISNQMIGPFRRRSSWPSSLATTLIGWVGFSTVIPLALGHDGPLATLFAAAVVCATAQAVLLRVAFNRLRLHQSIVAGSIWGAITGAVLSGVCAALFLSIRPHPVVAVASGGYIGAAVGIFLSYFHRDDRRIEAEARSMGLPI